jgi:hypothetical protein
MVPPPYHRSYASATAVARPAALTTTADHVPDPTHADLARLPVADDAADTTAVTSAVHTITGIAVILPRRPAISCPPMPTTAATALTDSAYAPIFASAADQLPTPAQAAPSTNAAYADDAADTIAAYAAELANMNNNMHARLALLRVQDEAYKAQLVQRAASVAIRDAQLVSAHRHANDAPQQGQLTALASVRRKATAHAAESARIAASLPQRFDPPLPARCYHSKCLEVQLGLRSVDEVMTLRGTPARTTFRPARFPRQDPLPGQTAAMRQSKAKAMRQAKARAVQQSKQAKPTCKYATWTRLNHLRLTLA